MPASVSNGAAFCAPWTQMAELTASGGGGAGASDHVEPLGPGRRTPLGPALLEQAGGPSAHPVAAQQLGRELRVEEGEVLAHVDQPEVGQEQLLAAGRALGPEVVHDLGVALLHLVEVPGLADQRRVVGPHGRRRAHEGERGVDQTGPLDDAPGLVLAVDVRAQPQAGGRVAEALPPQGGVEPAAGRPLETATSPVCWASDGPARLIEKQLPIPGSLLT